jgi:recombination protein RecA
MPAAARALKDDLELLLRLKKLDHTLTNTLPSTDGTADARWVVPTGISQLDARLQGGIPRGHLSEFVGPRSSGRLAVVMSALAGATSRGEAAALIDPLDLFDPASASAAGIDFTRMLWIRGQAGASNAGWKAPSSARLSLSCEYGMLLKSLDAAVKALNLVLQAGGFGLVVLDLAEVAPQVVRRLPFTTWLRLHRVIESSETACVLIGSEPTARSAGGVSVQLVRPKAESLKPEASVVHARVVRARAIETSNVCVPLSAAAC